MKRTSDRTDRISSLPDDVLAHVLSFLDTRDAVRTCVLSKRWRNTWTIVPVLNFDFYEFPTKIVSEDDDDDINENIKEELRFDSFVCSVLEKRGPSHVDTVTFTGEFSDHFCEPSMRWFHRAALLMPRVISAMIPSFELEELNLPDSVFSCASLELLELIDSPYVGGKAYLKQNSISLVSLKTLMLVNLVLDDDFARKLLLGCPVLKDLQLFDCELFISDISSNVLKRLIIDDCWLLQHMRISCPLLVSLFISSCKNTIRIISLENLTSLLYATIELVGSDEQEVDTLPKLKLFSGLSNAAYLKLLFRPLPELKAIDRISSLPDDALTCLLSFLTTKEAVETCILSKRWRNTWASVPILNFDFDEFQAGDEESCEENELKFGRFVTGVLENRGPSHVDTFIIRGEFESDFMDPFMGLLDRAAFLMPRVICADIPDRSFAQQEFNLPDSVFSCSRLENLELYQPEREFMAIEQNSIDLPSLKTLKLSSLELRDDFVQKLLLGCPALETLMLFDCILSLSDFSSNSLRELNLDTCSCFSQHLRISCPVLISLIIRSEENINRSISFENMASLVNACIKIIENDEVGLEIAFNKLPNTNFLSALSNATSLKLDVMYIDPYYKELWVKDISNFRTF